MRLEQQFANVESIKSIESFSSVSNRVLNAGADAAAFSLEMLSCVRFRVWLVVNMLIRVKIWTACFEASDSSVVLCCVVLCCVVWQLQRIMCVQNKIESSRL